MVPKPSESPHGGVGAAGASDTDDPRSLDTMTVALLASTEAMGVVALLADGIA
jgi:hypothetical protein